jgi:hypothetical protein
MSIKIIQDAEYGTIRVNDFDGLLGSEKHSNPMISDAIDTGVFFARQLESIKAQSYDVKYANLKFREMFPVTNETPEGAEAVTYRTYDQTGIAKFIGSYGKDIPRADIGGKETLIAVKGMAIGFGFTLQEIRAAAMTGLPLDSRKSAAAVKGAETVMNDVAFFGDAVQGLEGIFSHPNIPTAAAPNGAAVSPLWSTKTPDEILLDLNNCVNDIFTDSLMVEVPDTLALSPERHALIATTPRASNSDTTILQFFAANSPHISGPDKVVSLNECSAAVRNSKGLSNVDVMLGYRNSSDAMEFEEPMPLKFHPEQREGLEILVPGEARTGGLNVYYPLSANIVTGI